MQSYNFSPNRNGQAQVSPIVTWENGWTWQTIDQDAHL